MGCLYQTDGKIDGMLLDAFDIEGRHMKEVVGSINDDDNNHGFTFEMVQAWEEENDIEIEDQHLHLVGVGVITEGKANAIKKQARDYVSAACLVPEDELELTQAKGKMLRSSCSPVKGSSDDSEVQAKRRAKKAAEYNKRILSQIDSWCEQYDRLRKGLLHEGVYLKGPPGDREKKKGKPGRKPGSAKSQPPADKKRARDSEGGEALEDLRKKYKALEKKVSEAPSSGDSLSRTEHHLAIQEKDRVISGLQGQERKLMLQVSDLENQIKLKDSELISAAAIKEADVARARAEAELAGFKTASRTYMGSQGSGRFNNGRECNSSAEPE